MVAQLFWVANRASTYDGFAATRGMIPTTVSAIVHANVRSGHYARTNLTQLKILLPNYVGLGEAAPGATMSVTASVEYPAGTLTQILFSGSATGTISNGGTLISDFVTPSIPIPNSDRFWIRLFLQNSVGIPTLSSIYADNNTNFMGDALEDSAIDRTMSGVIPASQNLSYHPTVIAPMTAPSVLVLGDSIALGVSDTLDVTGDMGIVAREVGSTFGYSNAGVNAATASGFVANHTQRLLLLPFSTHVFVNFATNDIFAGDSAATIKGNLTTIYGLVAPKTTFQLTVVPRTTSTDGWVTTANQTVLATEGVRTSLNADFLSTFGPGGGVFNTAAVVEAAAGKWIANKTTDGVHPDNAGYLDVKASGAINTALIGTPDIPPTETGSAWGDTGTLLTRSTTGSLTNNTVNHPGANANTTARGAGSNSSGLKMFEVEVLTSSNILINIGLLNGTTAGGAGLDSFMGNIDDSFGIHSAGAGYKFASGIFTATSAGAYDVFTGDVFDMAVDFTNKFAYLRRNGVWLNGGVPTSGATGTGHIATWTGTPTLFPGVTLFAAGDSVRIRTNKFQYPLPSGYSAWG